jgi:CSLREA domain-containing protein
MKKPVIATHRIVFNAFLLAALLLAGLLLPSGRALAQPTLPAPMFDVAQTGPTYVVNTVADSNDGVCGTGDCSLREAILAVNAAPNVNNQITFNIASGCNASTGVCTIMTGGELPPINSTMAVVVDGYTQPGASANTLAVGDDAKPLIEVNGTNSGGANSGILVYSANATVKGLVVNHFNFCFYLATTITGLKVQGNFIGTSSTGKASGACTVGIYYESPTGPSTIGGTAPAERNILSGNTTNAILVKGSSNNVIQGNYIGVDTTGMAKLANGTDGIRIQSSSSNTLIGGTAAGAGNVISGNAQNAIVVYNSSGTTVQGNYIGVSATGATALGNASSGFYMTNSPNTIIGGTAAGAGNVISGNGAGIYIDPASNDFVIQGNKIGTNAAGTAAFPNTDGVLFSYVTSGTLGGTSASARNIISGNSRYGVNFLNSASGIQVQGNYIGTDVTGMAKIANASYGILLTASSPNNTIGGTAAGAGNVISGNGGTGIIVDGATTSGNQIQGNLIGTNAAGTAALANNGYGVAVSNSAPNTIIGGTSAEARNVISGNSNVGLNLFSAPGTQVLGNYIGTNINGTAVIPNGDYGVYVAYSPNVVIGGAAAGAGNLISGNPHDAIFVTYSNAITVKGNTIGTNAAGTAALGNLSSGVYLWYSPGATIGGTAAGEGNLLSGNATGIYVHVGSNSFIIQGNKIGTNVTGTAAIGNTTAGIWISDVTSGTIGGTTASARNIISGNTGYGIQNGVFGPSSGVVVQGNYIGTDVTGTAKIPNTNGGIYQQNGTGNTFGGTAAGAGNLISGNTGSGITITTNGNTIQGNLIGTNAAGTAALANSSYGVYISGVTSETVGGTTAAARNVISGNTSAGIYITGSSSNVQVQGNYIGTDITGTTKVGNNYGIYIVQVQNNFIGGSAAGAGNVISGNSAEGVVIDGGSAQGNYIQGNLIGTNATGTAALGNNIRGVIVTNVASNNRIGGTAAGEGNLISGNTGVGVGIYGNNNQILGNKIGTNLAGTAALPNTTQGINISDGSGNIVGSAAGGNLISGNGQDGVQLAGSSSSTTVAGNKIGTDVNGTAKIPNASSGISFIGVSGTVGGTTAGAGNLISGNAGNGIYGNSISGITVQGNFIGTDVSGALPLGNSTAGISIDTCSNWMIGGTAAGAGNIIADNTGKGILLQGATSGNAILGNRIFNNGGLGIDLGNDGVTHNDTNDADSGANGLQNFPMIFVAGGGTALNTQIFSSPSTTYRIEFFANTTCDPTGYGQGEVYLGTTDATTSSGGSTSLIFNFTPVAGKPYYSATATNTTNGATSEFSPCTPFVTTTTVSALPTSSTYGTSVTFTATVTQNIPASDFPYGSLIPFGEARFTDNGASLGSQVYLDAAGKATFTTSTLTASTHPIRAVFISSEIYQASSSSALNYVVSPKALTVSGITADDKPYDRTTGATIHTGAAALAGVVSPDLIGVDGSAAAGTFDTRNAGTDKTVTITGLALTGTMKGNYTLGAATALADITPLKVGVSGITASDKPYDGTTDATLDVSGAAITAGVVISPDVVGVDASAATGAFDTKEIGTNKTVTISDLALTGGDKGNYELDTVTTKAAITTNTLTISGAVAQDKDYDGNPDAQLDLTNAKLEGVAVGDVVTLDKSAVTGAFDTKTVGTNKTVTFSGFALGGANMDNYTLTQPTAKAAINPIALSLTADDQTKVFGETLPALTISYAGFISGDTAANSLTGSANIYTDATDTSPAGPYTIYLEKDTLSAVNYTLSFKNGTMTVDPADTTTAVSYAPVPAYATDSVTITAVVKPVAPGAGDASGNVVFKDNGSLLATAALVKNTTSGMMEATYTSTTLAEGSHPITAEYGASTDFNASSGAKAVVIVPMADLSLDMQVSDNPVASNAPLTLTATVTNSGPSQAANAEVSLVIPTGLTYVSNSAGCAYAGGTLTCDLGSVDSAATPAVTVTLNATSATGFFNIAGSVTSDTHDPVSNESQTLKLLVQDALFIYDQDVDSNLGDHWTDATQSTPSCGDTTPFLGEFGNQTENLHLGQVPAHNVVTVSFDLYVLRSWDGNLTTNESGSTIGPDVFDLRQTAATSALLHTTFSNWDRVTFRQAFPGNFPGGDYPARTGATAINSLCYTYGDKQQDAIYHLTYSFIHTGSSLSLDFSALGLQAITDESWGINHLKVSVGVLNNSTYLPIARK